MILCDTGVLLCLVDQSQPQHSEYIALVKQLEKPLITTWVCMGEAMYLALHRGGWPMQKQLAKMLLLNLLTIGEIDDENYPRLFALMEKYQDRPMDLADATLVLIAEKQREKRILTLDSDFLFYRILDKNNFQVILP
ncbi:MAG: PIN domain-containing protein [Merismopediaceae bacterium]|nr:PIN domain-containing protein [Merismopediaceae bacterium]